MTHFFTFTVIYLWATQHRLLLEIYFMVNTFISGWLAGDDWTWAKTAREKVILILRTLVYVIWFLPYVVILCLLILGEAILDKVDKHQIIKVHFAFYFTRQYSNMDKRALYALNENCNKNRTSDSFNDRFWRYVIKKVNKRNNYIHTLGEPPEYDNE